MAGVFEEVFGRIDRNTDVDFRNRNLIEQQRQFDLQRALEAERLEASKNQFQQTFGLQRDQFGENKRQFNSATDMTVADRIASGQFAPANFAQEGAMQLGGSVIRPTDPIDRFKRAKGAETEMSLDAAKKMRADIATFAEKEGGLHPILAAQVAMNPDMLPQLTDPKRLMSAMLTGRMPESMINGVLASLTKQTSALSQAAETPSEKAARFASANAANMNARVNQFNLSQAQDMGQALPVINQALGQVMIQLGGKADYNNPAFAPMMMEEIRKMAEQGHITPGVAGQAQERLFREFNQMRQGGGGNNFIQQLLMGGGTTPTVNTPTIPTPAAAPSGPGWFSQLFGHAKDFATENFTGEPRPPQGPSFADQILGPENPTKTGVGWMADMFNPVKESWNRSGPLPIQGAAPIVPQQTESLLDKWKKTYAASGPLQIK